MSKELKILQEHFPFLTLFEYSGEEYLGIIQNSGKNVISAYICSNIKDKELKKLFLEMGQIWWGESNRRIPINLFFKQDFDIFQPFVMNFVTKEFNIINGHSVSLQELNQKRVKRRRIELVIKPKS
jgi:hypothetical protein